MRLFTRSLYLLALTSLLFSTLQAQNSNVADRIVAIVADRIILKSDVDAEVRNFMQQSNLEDRNIEFSEDLWYSALQSMVDNYVLLEKAKIDSVIISDDMVNRRMDQRISQLIRQAGSEQALENAFGQSLVEIRAEFREQFREQLTVQQVQQNKMQEINITRPEVIEFFEEIPDENIPMIPEQVSISQIVAIPPPLEDARDAAFARAQTIRDSIVVHGKEFEEMARKYSQDATAARGGLLPLMPQNDLVSNYSAAASALQPGGVSEVVETQFGFHVIRLNRRVGDQIETNHILIRIGEESLDEEAAISKLEAIRDSVLNHDKSFAQMARLYSDDQDTKALGGKIFDQQSGRRLIPIEQLEPALYRIVLLLEEEGAISEPRPYNPNLPNTSRAYRIVRLDEHIPEHLANLEDDYDRIQEIALQRKRTQEMSEWINDLRKEVYVEFKIHVPNQTAATTEI